MNNKCYNNQMLKFIRIFLLGLIIIGLLALATQKIWVPKLVEWIIAKESVTTYVVPRDTVAKSTVVNNKFAFEYTIM